LDISCRGQELIRFTQELIALRHKYQVLRRPIGAMAACFGMLMDGRSQTAGIRKRGQEATLLRCLTAITTLSSSRFQDRRKGKAGICWSTPICQSKNDQHLFPFGLSRDWPIGIAVPPAKVA
jgi:hypothetical protein